MQPDQQPEPPRRARSPKGGAELPCGKDHPGSWKPGQSGNPAGTTAARRVQAELEKALRGPKAKEIIDAQVQLASNAAAGSASTGAFRALASLLGLDRAEGAATVTLRHEVVFADRPDESEHPAVFETRQPAQLEAAQPETDVEEIVDEL